MKGRTVLLFLALLLCLPTLTVAQGSGPKYEVLNWQRVEARGQSTGMRLFLNLLRNDSPLLDDEDVFRYFMAANNCDNANAFMHELSSEFDYGGMAKFYKGQAPEILKSTPNSLSMMLTGFFVGQYDSAKGVFPFVEGHGQKKTTVINNLDPRNDLRDTCPSVGLNIGRKREFFPYQLQYQINVKPATISELPMDEASARAFVEGLRLSRPGQGRSVLLLVDLEILPTATKLGQRMSNGAYPPVNFDGKIAKITVLNAESQKSIGVIVP
jgi:hypothetical protein